MCLSQCCNCGNGKLHERKYHYDLAIVGHVGGKGFTQRMYDVLIHLVVEKQYKFDTVRRIFYTGYNITLENEQIVEAVRKIGQGRTFLGRDRALWTIVTIDGVDLTQDALSHIVFLHSERKYSWQTIARFLELSHGIQKETVTSRMIAGVLKLHEYVAKGQYRTKSGINPVLLQRQPAAEIEHTAETYSELASWHKEMVGKYIYQLRYNFGVGPQPKQMEKVDPQELPTTLHKRWRRDYLVQVKEKHGGKHHRQAERRGERARELQASRNGRFLTRGEGIPPLNLIEDEQKAEKRIIQRRNKAIKRDPGTKEHITKGKGRLSRLALSDLEKKYSDQFNQR